jgi:hypothetical protein
MSPLVWLRNLCSKGQPKKEDESILTLQEQIKAWRKANRKMAWGIAPEEFDIFETIPGLSDDDRFRLDGQMALIYTTVSV